MDRPTTKEVARFFDKVNITKHCWLWTATICNKYGQFGYRGRRVRAHRFSYELFVEPIKAGYCVLHRKECGNPSCVNPHHLYMGTHSSNMKDRDIWGNLAVGSKHGNSKLTEEDVLNIRGLYKPNVFGYMKIAKMFNVSPRQIAQIVRGTYWKHL